MGHIADEDVIYDLDDDPIVKVHLYYTELFGKDCTDEVARQILKDQQDSIDLFSKIESGTRYICPDLLISKSILKIGRIRKIEKPKWMHTLQD